MISPKKWHFEGGEAEKPEHAGRSILEMLWEELDVIMDRLMDDESPWDWRETSKGSPPGYQDFQKYGEERGQAQGVAFAIATMTNPYAPNVPGIKREAVERWEARQDA